MQQLQPEPQIEVEMEEYLQLLANSQEFFNREMFPDTVGQESPGFHFLMDEVLDDPLARFCNFQIFRGGAKTTKVRTYLAKRVAFAVSRTILIVGKSEGHAILTVGWLKRQIMRNKKFAGTFGLVKGEKWAEGIIQIRNEVAGCDIWVLAYGITGSTRGINIDDHRPDLILVDDVVDDENALTPEGRMKTNALVHGALKNSLAPASEAPLAKMVIAQTPIDKEDVSCQALLNPEFKSLQFGCWSKDTESLDLTKRESAWPARWSSEVLRRQKLDAIASNTLSIFAREMECQLVTPETATFRMEWLQYWDELPPRHEMHVIMVIDPVPPPSEAQLAKGLVGKDYEAFAVMGRWRGNIYLIESVYNRGHDPSWTLQTFAELNSRWRPRSVHVESVAYQRTLAWLIKQAMRQAGSYVMVDEFVDRRAKDVKIKDGLIGVSSNRALYVHRKHSEFIGQFAAYGALGGSRNPDDVIETVALGATILQKGSIAGDEYQNYMAPSDADIPDLEDYRGAP
jgi:hypothetical protein